MVEDVYIRLREFLDNLPGGFPVTDIGVEIRILKKLFTPQEAEIVMKLDSMPAPIYEIAPRLGLTEKEAEEKIEAMAKNGLLFRLRAGEEVYYGAVSFIVGIYEFTLNRLDRELSGYVEDYLPYLKNIWESHKTQHLRVVPINSALKAASEVSTYNRIRELVKDKELISVSTCICSKGKHLLGDPCNRPTERCVMFDMAAQYYIENGMARQIGREELMDLLKMGEENSLVINANNSKDINGFCMCCSCCCGALSMLRMMDRPADIAQTSYYAGINPELCSTCGLCVERCQMHAIKEGEEGYAIDTARCIGCGLCVPTCPEEAISLVEKPGVESLPDNYMETFMRISKERGVL